MYGRLGHSEIQKYIFVARDIDTQIFIEVGDISVAPFGCCVMYR